MALILVWQCKLAGPLREPPKDFDDRARELLERLYFELTSQNPDLVQSSWDGTLTPEEIKLLHERFPDTPEYQ